MEQAHQQTNVRHNNRVYAPLVVMWLLVVQRLQGGAPLEAAVLELLRGLPEGFWPRPCKRIRDWREYGKHYPVMPGRIIKHGGGYLCQWWKQAVIASSMN